MKKKPANRGLGFTEEGDRLKNMPSRRAALKRIQREYLEKEWRLRDASGPHSVPADDRPRVIFAKPNKED